MEEEQIEQKAEEYTDSKFERDTLWWADAYEAYIAGATENGTQWHDLRKDPNDLPKEYNREYYCYTTDGYESVGVYKLAGDDEVRWDSMNRVIGWLDAPEFKEAKQC